MPVNNMIRMDLKALENVNMVLMLIMLLGIMLQSPFKFISLVSSVGATVQENIFLDQLTQMAVLPLDHVA